MWEGGVPEMNHYGLATASSPPLLDCGGGGRGVQREVEPGKGKSKGVALMFVFFFSTTQIDN